MLTHCGARCWPLRRTARIAPIAAWSLRLRDVCGLRASGPLEPPLSVASSGSARTAARSAPLGRCRDQS
eukprot:4993820-Alexandrium_andersonii.AAC.1